MRGFPLEYLFLTDLTKTVLLAVFLDGRCRCKLGELLKTVTGHSNNVPFVHLQMEDVKDRSPKKKF